LIGLIVARCFEVSASSFDAYISKLADRAIGVTSSNPPEPVQLQLRACSLSFLLKQPARLSSMLTFDDLGWKSVSLRIRGTSGVLLL